MKVYSLFLFFLFLSSKVCLAQQPQATNLPEVVVTATRTPIPLEQLTTSLTVITAEEIRAQQAETVLEALRTVPGLDVVQSGSRGGRTDVFIRGSEEDQVLVLIDGVEVNSTTLGALDLAHLTTESIERIEILRGAGGTLYGSQALGGVIHILTKKGQGKPEFLLSAEGGNGETHRQVLSLGGGTDRLAYFLSGARLETSGFRPFNDDYQNIAVGSRLDLQVMDNAVLRSIFHFRKSDTGLFNNNNSRTRLGDPNARENVTDYLFKFEWEHDALPPWNYKLSVSQFKQHDKFSDDLDSFDTRRRRDRFRPRILAGELQTNYRWGEWNTTSFGLEYKDRRAITDDIREGQRNLASYLQQQMGFLNQRLFLLAGIRLDDHESFGREWSPAASAAYLIRETGTKLNLSYAQGFKAPTLSELFFPNLGNPDLKPETSWEINLGIEQSFEKLKFGVTLFHRDVEDLIIFAPATFQAANVGNVRVDGVEVFGSLRLTPSLLLQTNYTFLESDTSGGRLVRRPRHRGSIVLGYEQNEFRMNLKANIVGRRDDFAAMGRRFISNPGYVRFNVAASYTFPWTLPGVKRFRLYGKIENLFNKKYDEADGFLARPFNFLIGIEAVFGKFKERR